VQGVLPLPSGLPCQPVLRHDDESVHDIELPVHERRPVRERTSVLQRNLHRGQLLQEFRLRRRHSNLQEQHVRRRVSFREQLPRRSVLQHGDK
jgi:hypothetical protein